MIRQYLQLLLAVGSGREERAAHILRLVAMPAMIWQQNVFSVAQQMTF